MALRQVRKRPLVGIVIASESDLPVMERAMRLLKEFGVPYQCTLTSAHRSPRRTHRFIAQVERQGLEVLVAGAGGAAHLAGVLAAETVLPVIGVPLNSTPLGGLDALLSTVQMPRGVPVATIGIGAAENAALLAIQILARKYPVFRPRLKQYKQRLERQVAVKQRRLTTP